MRPVGVTRSALPERANPAILSQHRVWAHLGDGLGVGGSDARDNLDDVVLQGKDRYRKRWEQYADGAHAFRVVDQESICGRVQRR